MEVASAKDVPGAMASSVTGDRTGRIYVPALDGIRGFAIVGIVILHAMLLSGALDPGRSWFRVVSWGSVGNILTAFFILSGFALFLSVVTRHGDLGGVRSYLIRRLARIYPPFWLTLAVILIAMAIALPTSITIGYPPLSHIVIDFTGLQMPVRMLNGSYLVGFGVDGALWFVSVILGFSILFAFIARAYYRHPLIGLATAAVITICWKEAALHFTGVFESIEGHNAPAWAVQLIAIDQLPGWAFSFALGMTAAWGYVKARETRTREQLERLAVAIAPVALWAMALSVYLFGIKAQQSQGLIAPSFGRASPWVQMLYSVTLTALMSMVLIGPGAWRKPFVARPIRRLGELSYGVYLIHIFVGIYLGLEAFHIPQNGSFISTALFFVVMMGGALVFAAFSLRFVERPARRWAARVTAPRTKQSPPGEEPSSLQMPAQKGSAIVAGPDPG